MPHDGSNANTKLDFKVIFASSEELGYKAERLLEHNALGSGWRTVRNCSYPQSVAISLDHVHEITTIQFIAHEFLVPSCVEFLLYNTQQRCWESIGKVQMGKDGKVTTGRERKTVKIDIKTNALRLILHEPIPHENNRYGQIGIAAISVFGNSNPTDIRPTTPKMGHPIVSKSKRSAPKPASGALSDKPAAGSAQPPSTGKSEGTDSQSGKLSYLEIGEKLKTEIMISKTKAAADEDFLLADRYKIAYDALGSLLADYASLDERKAAAIASENYRSAHEIKVTMKEVEDILNYPLEKLVCILNGEPNPPSPKSTSAPAPGSASTELKGSKPKHQVSYQSLEPLDQELGDNEDDLTTNDIAGGAYRSGSRPVRGESRPRAKARAPAAVPDGDDLSRAVPTISNQDVLNEHGDRMLHNNGGGGGYQQFVLTEEEKRALEQERKENYMRRRGTNLGASMVSKTRTAANSVGAGGDELGASVRMKQGGMGKSQMLKSQMTKTGLMQQFSFEDELNNVTSGRDKETAPPELPGSVMRGSNATKLKEAGFNEMYIRLAYSSNKGNVIDATNLMIRALVHDPASFYPAGISLVTIISESINTALIGLIGNLFCHVYLAILRRYRGVPNSDKLDASNKNDLVGLATQVKNTMVDAGDITLTFIDVTNQLSLQKENSVVYAELKCTSERIVERAIGSNLQNLHNDVILLLTPIINKLSDSQRRPKINAINMLATASTFPFFPTLSFINAIISRRAIEKASSLAQNELTFQNQKLLYLTETRSWATAILISGNQRLMTKDTILVLRAYIEWVIPYATKQEQKKPATDILLAMYGSLLSDMIGITNAVECVNKACTTEALLKTIYKAMTECDKRLNIKPPRVKLLPPTADAPAGKLVISIRTPAPSEHPEPKSKWEDPVGHNSHAANNHSSPTAAPSVQVQKSKQGDQQQYHTVAPTVQPEDDEAQYGEFPPGVCQFCLDECGQQEDMALNMYKHLLIKCPCCCACPACEAIIEIPCLPEHMAYECTHKAKLPYSLELCKNCRCIIESKYMEKHLETCHMVLGEEETICPLCGELLLNSEAALAHYSDGEGCPGNPRTAANLRNVVLNKVNSVRQGAQ